MENTSTSKAEGIEGAPQLWTLPLLEVRSMNKLSGPCQHTLTRRGLPSLRRCPRSGRTPCVAAVTCPELLLSASVFLFCLRVVYVTHAHPEDLNSSKEEKRMGWDYTFSFAKFSTVTRVWTYFCSHFNGELNTVAENSNLTLNQYG